MLPAAHPTNLLAANPGLSSDVMLWLGVITGLGILLAVVALVLRRKMFGREEAPPVGFTLADLRRMHAEGQLSDEELAQAESRTLSRSRSHYLGDEADAETDAGADEDAGNDALDAPSTGDPQPGEAGAENPEDPPDKNPGDASAG